MNTYLLSFLIASVTWLIIFTLEFLKAKTAARKHHPPRFVDCGAGLRKGRKVYFKGLWVEPAYITPLDDGNFQFLYVYANTHPIIFHAVRGDNRDGEWWHIYQVEYATTLETLKEANRIIDASINAKQ